MTACLERFLPLYSQNDDQRIYGIKKKRAALAAVDLQSVRMDYMCCEDVVHELRELLFKNPPLPPFVPSAV